MTETTEAPEQATPPDADAPEPDAPDAQWLATVSRRGSSAWLAWTVAVALGLVAAVALVQWRAVTGPAGDVQDAGVAAAAYVQRLSNWDATDGLDETYTALVAGASDRFAPEIDEVFGPQVRAGLVAIDAVSTGTIEDVLTGVLERGEPDAVTIVVFAEQFVVSGPTADPVARTDRVTRLRMVRADGGWLVDDLEMLSEVEVVETGAEPEEDQG